MKTIVASFLGCGLLLSWILAATGGAHAGEASAAPETLERFCAAADHIVHGRVIARTVTAADSDGHYWTVYTIAVTEDLATTATAPGVRLEVREIGGEDPQRGVRQIATGAVTLRQNEEVILFTRDYGLGWQSVAEGERGCLRVKTLPVATADGRSALRHITPAARNLAPGLPAGDLDQLKARLRAARAAGQAQAQGEKEHRS